MKIFNLYTILFLLISISLPSFLTAQDKSNCESIKRVDLLRTGCNEDGFSWTTGMSGNLIHRSGKAILATNTADRVGLGTTEPLYKLHTIGDIYANGGWMRVSGGAGLYFQSYGGGFRMTDNTWIRTYGNKSFYHNTGIMRTDGTFQVGPSGNRFIVNSSGNVGIGTVSPQSPLHIVRGGDVSLTGNGQLLMGNTNAANIALDGNEIQARNNGRAATLFLQFSGGNTSLGPINPSYQFQLSRNSAAKPYSSLWYVSSDKRLKKDISKGYTKGGIKKIA